MDILKEWDILPAIVKGKAIRQLRLFLAAETPEFKFQKHFAHHCKVAHSHLNEVERGKKNIRWDELSRILHATQTPRSVFEEFLDEEYQIFTKSRNTEVFVLRRADLYQLESMIPGTQFREIMKMLESRKMGINAYKRLFQEEEVSMQNEQEEQQETPMHKKLSLLWNILSNPAVLKAAADATVTDDVTNAHASGDPVVQGV